MDKNRILEKIKTNNFIKFCIIQFAFYLLYRLLIFGSQYYNNLKFIHLIFLIINESWFLNIFWKRYRRKALIDNQGYIKEVNHKKTQIKYIFKIFLITLIYVVLNVILSSFNKLMLSNLVDIQDIEIVIKMVWITHIFLELFRIIISEQFGVYVPIITVILILGVFASFSNNILATFLISTLFLGVINWLVSEDAFIYLQDLIDISTNLTISIDMTSKKMLSKVRARALFVSIAYNLSILTSESVLKNTEIRKILSNLIVTLKISGQDNQIGQNYFSNFIVKVGFLVLYYLILKIFIDNMFRKRESYGIPIVSNILNSYNDLILKEFKNQIKNKSLNEIRIKQYYVKKINKYFIIRNKSKLYVHFDEQDIFDHYISSKTYKSMNMSEKRKYCKTNKRKIFKQIEILEATLESTV